MAEIKLTNANRIKKFISFSVKGLEDQIQVGIIYPNRPNNFEQALSIAYKGQVYNFPLTATSEDIKKINASYEEENLLEDMFENGQQVKIGNLYADKETYEWLTTPSDEDDDVGYWQPNQVTELDDEAYDKFEKEVMNPEIDEKRVEAAKKIFEGVDKVINDIKIEKIVETPVDISDSWKYELTYGKPHLLELMDEWGVDGTNYADFRSVIQEHCFDKGIYDLESIKNTWKEFKDSLENISEHLKEI